MRAVQLHDIADVEGYVRAAIAKTSIEFPCRDDREELVSEGLISLCDLARRYTPRLEGYAQDGSFAGWASKILPLRLISAWHTMNPEHVLRTTPGGQRQWEYLDVPDSWEAKNDANEAAFDSTSIAMAFSEDNMRRVGDFTPVLQPLGASMAA